MISSYKTKDILQELISREEIEILLEDEGEIVLLVRSEKL